jgi:hypothetical protein
LELPSHCSGVSQGSFGWRHTVEAERLRSVGHARDAPLQLSAASQVPAAARQSVPASSGIDTHVFPMHSRTPQAKNPSQDSGLQAAQAGAA